MWIWAHIHGVPTGGRGRCTTLLVPRLQTLQAPQRDCIMPNHERMSTEFESALLLGYCWSNLCCTSIKAPMTMRRFLLPFVTATASAFPWVCKPKRGP